MNFLTGKLVQAICWTLLHSLWQGLLLAIVTGVVMVLSKKSGSALRYKLLSTIFIAFVAITGFTFYKQLQAAGAVAPTGINLAAPLTHVTPAAPVNLNNYSTPAVAVKNNNLQHYVNGFVRYFDEHASLFVTIWFIIFMAQCIKILSGLVHIQRIRHYKTNPASAFWVERIEQLAKRLNIKKHILLLESAIIKVPAVVGFLKPTILVPLGLINNLSQEEVESILMHELAHIRRKDYLFNLLQCFIDIIFFFNPAVLWISSLIRNERENCCDDIAISETKNKKQFIQALVSFHQYNTSVSKYAMPFAARKHKLVDRVKRIVNNNNNTLNPGEKIVLVGCLVAFGVAFVTISNGQTDTTKKKAPQSTSSTQNKTGSSTQKSAGTQKQVQKTAPAAEQSASKNSDDDNNENYGNYTDLGYKNITVDQLIELRNHGVSEEFLKDLNTAGYKNIPLNKAIELKDHGVDVDFINSINAAGYKSLSLNDFIELKDHGINTEYINEMASLGYKNLSLDKLTELRDHGVNTEFFSEMNKLGYKNLSLDKAIELKDQGISVGFMNELVAAGFKNVTPDEAIEVRGHGIDANYINSFKQAGYNDVTIDKLIELKDHGVTVAFINELRKQGVTNLTLDQAIEYKNQGFDAGYLATLRNAGYSNITVDKAMELKDHGISIEYINSFKKYGFTNIAVDKLIELKDHGVSTSFIEKMKVKTGSTFTLDEYIKLKDSGFDGK